MLRATLHSPFPKPGWPSSAVRHPSSPQGSWRKNQEYNEVLGAKLFWELSCGSTVRMQCLAGWTSSTDINAARLICM